MAFKRVMNPLKACIPHYVIIMSFLNSVLPMKEILDFKV